jgi:hypothetical protein
MIAALRPPPGRINRGEGGKRVAFDLKLSGDTRDDGAEKRHRRL